MTEEQKRQILDILIEAVCVVTDPALAERMERQIRELEAELDVPPLPEAEEPPVGQTLASTKLLEGFKKLQR